MKSIVLGWNKSGRMLTIDVSIANRYRADQFLPSVNLAPTTDMGDKEERRGSDDDEVEEYFRSGYF